jgi:hypothetical protein
LTNEKPEPLTPVLVTQVVCRADMGWLACQCMLDAYNVAVDALSLERTARQKAEERVRELEDVISGCVLCSSPDTRWDEAMARYRAALTTDPPKEG